MNLSYLSETPPSDRELVSRVAALGAQSLNRHEPDYEQLLGIPQQLGQALHRGETGVERFDELSARHSYWWQLLKERYRGARVAMFHRPDLGKARIASQAMQAMHGAAEQANAYVLLMITDAAPSHPTFAAPDGVVRILAPFQTDQQLRLSWTRIGAISAGPDGWDPVHDSDRLLIGWVDPQKTTVRWRFNPLLGKSQRLTMGSREQRRRTLASMTAASIHAASNVCHDEIGAAQIAAWQQTVRRCAQMIVTVRGAGQTFDQQLAFAANQRRQLDTQLSNQTTRMEQLRSELATLETEREWLHSELDQVAEFRAGQEVEQRALLARREHILTGMLDTVEQVAALPHVQSVSHTNSASPQIIVTLAPLTVCCEQTNRIVDGLGLTMSLDTRAGDIVLTRHGLPFAWGAPGGAFNWGESSMALATALGTYDLRAAVAVACGWLSRPRPDTPLVSLPEAPANARPGFHLTERPD